jgi:hypothetical protein
MTIETLIQENTQALRDLADAIRAIVITTPAAKPAAEPEAVEQKVEKPKAKKAAPIAAEPETSAPDETPAAQPEETAAAQPEEAAQPDAPQCTYEEVAAAVKHVATVKGRDAAVALLAEFGATNAKQLTEDKWPTFVAKATA